MKESIGGTWLFQIAIVFILLFSGYLALSVNYSKAFRVKNEILSIIERREGVTQSAQSEIKAYLENNNHTIYGNCSEKKNETGYLEQSNTRKHLYCIIPTCIENSNFKKAYYKVTVFFKLDVPYLGDLLTFRVQGETKQVSYPADGACSK